MKDKDIDEILKRAAQAPQGVDPALLNRVSASIKSSLRPVAPMPPAWLLVSGLLLISAVIAIAAAGWFGFEGFRRLHVTEIGMIFPALAILTCLAATLSVDEMTPGSARWLSPALLLLMIVAGWIAMDAALFHDYGMSGFMPEGIPCLRAGVAIAIPSGIASWIVLRRGFAVNLVSAGLAAGTLAGLAGLTMLELHCPNFRAPHVMVWHTAVIPFSAFIGALFPFIFGRRNS